MPRQPKPYFRKQTQSWYCSIDGRQIALGKDRELAHQKFHELMADRDAISSELVSRPHVKRIEPSAAPCPAERRMLLENVIQGGQDGHAQDDHAAESDNDLLAQELQVFGGRQPFYIRLHSTDPCFQRFFDLPKFFFRGHLGGEFPKFKGRPARLEQHDSGDRPSSH